MSRGGGMYGKLGHGNEVGHSTPKRVDALVGLAVSQIACGSRHTAIITSSGAIYTWGDKENGVTGHGDTDGHQYSPKLLERLAGKRCVPKMSLFAFQTKWRVHLIVYILRGGDFLFERKKRID